MKYIIDCAPMGLKDLYNSVPQGLHPGLLISARWACTYVFKPQSGRNH